jgi:hypothetical protein
MAKKQRVVIEIYDPKELKELLKECVKKEYLKKYKELYGVR